MHTHLHCQYVQATFSIAHVLYMVCDAISPWMWHCRQIVIALYPIDICKGYVVDTSSSFSVLLNIQLQQLAKTIDESCFLNPFCKDKALISNTACSVICSSEREPANVNSLQIKIFRLCYWCPESWRMGGRKEGVRKDYSACGLKFNSVIVVQMIGLGKLCQHNFGHSKN